MFLINMLEVWIHCPMDVYGTVCYDEHLRRTIKQPSAKCT